MSRNKTINYVTNTKCLYCGKEYYRFPYEIRNGIKLTCSLRCRVAHFKEIYNKNHTPNTKCANCGKLFYRTLKRKHSKSGLYFCSKDCQNKGYKKHIVKSGPKERKINPATGKPYTEKERLHKSYFTLGRVCKLCGVPIWNNNKSGYCVKCGPKVRAENATPEQRQKWSEDAKIRMKQGKIKSWQSRNKLSYPEKFFKKVLENNKIKFEGPNFVVKQKDIGIPNCLPSSCYFLDFKIGSVDLEIDGKQHQYKERIEADNKRDKYLTEAGYKVYRIKWRSINTKSGKEYIKSEIEKLLKFLSNIK